MTVSSLPASSNIKSKRNDKKGGSLSQKAIQSISKYSGQGDVMSPGLIVKSKTSNSVLNVSQKKHLSALQNVISSKNTKASQRTRIDYSSDVLRELFHLPLKKAAENLNVCEAVLKRICRRNGIKKWPFRQVRALQRKREKPNGKSLASMAAMDTQIRALQDKIDAAVVENQDQDLARKGKGSKSAQSVIGKSNAAKSNQFEKQSSSLSHDPLLQINSKQPHRPSPVLDSISNHSNFHLEVQLSAINRKNRIPPNMSNTRYDMPLPGYSETPLETKKIAQTDEFEMGSDRIPLDTLFQTDLVKGLTFEPLWSSENILPIDQLLDEDSF